MEIGLDLAPEEIRIFAIGRGVSRGGPIGQDGAGSMGRVHADTRLVLHHV